MTTMDNSQSRPNLPYSHQDSPSKMIALDRKLLAGSGRHPQLSAYYDHLESAIWELKKARTYLEKS